MATVTYYNASEFRSILNDVGSCCPTCQELNRFSHNDIFIWNYALILFGMTNTTANDDSINIHGPWYTNSWYSPFVYTRDKEIAVWITFSLALCFLLHSAFINKLQFHKIRIFSDSISTLTIITMALLDYSGRNPESFRTVILIQGSLCYGVLGSSLQVIDNYFVYVLYYAAQIKVHKLERIIAQAWIWTTFLTYLPWVTIIPLFQNCNEPIILKYSVWIGSYGWSCMYILYNIYFGFNIWYSLRKKYNISERKIKNPGLAIVSYRNLFHLLIV